MRQITAPRIMKAPGGMARGLESLIRGIGMDVDQELNVLGKVCPMPLVALNKAMRKTPKDQLLRIIGDDPLFEEAILDFCRENGYEVMETNRNGRQVSIVFRT